MDALYIYKNSVHDDFEIRYSLRSIEQYAPWIRKVWIFGDKPHFLCDDTSLIEHVPDEYTARALGIKTPVTNFFLLFFLSSLIPDLESEYIFFCDDYFLLRDYSIEESRKMRYLEDLSGVKVRGRGVWKEYLWRTYELLRRLGYTGYNFEVHVPMHFTRKRVLEAYCEFRDFVTEDRWYGMNGLAAIFNHAIKQEKLKREDMVLLSEENSRLGYWGKPPAYEEVVLKSLDKTFLNFDDNAFGDGLYRFVTERFPKPSRFEKDES